jgi:8-oxo-dGTP pyrophosphatase MutT (NUDIX family)
MVVVVMGPEGTLAGVVDHPTEPRPAATVILLRGGRERLEVLLVRRNPAARFMPGVWVFPGGALDGTEDARAAAVREVAEEAGVTLPDPDALVPFSRWITPEQVSIRFDTHFFLGTAPDDAQPCADGGETVEVGWFAPRAALDDLSLVFPTIKTLERLSEFDSADELLEWAAGRAIEPVEPRVVDGRIVLPWEPGYRA